MNNFLKIFKYIFYRLITKKMLITIILGLLCFIMFNNCNVFASDIPFEGNVETGAWNTIINLPEFTDGLHYVFITKYYSTYKVFFVNKVSNFKCYFVKENNTVSKYGILNENNHLYFNRPVTLNIYDVTVSGSSSKKYTNVLEDSFICINPYDHGYANCDIYTDNTYTTLFFQYSEPYIEPYFSETNAQLSSLTTPYITLYGGSVPNNRVIVFSINLITGSESSQNVWQLALSNTSLYYKENNGDYYYEIPVGLFRNQLVFGKEYYFSTYWSDGVNDYTTSRLVLFSGLSGQEQGNIQVTEGFENVNNNLQDIKQQNEKIIKQQQEETDTAKDTNRFLKDDSFNSGDLNIPTDNTQDITEDGINNIFTQIYNGFTSGAATDIVIPIPFTNKNITINSNLTSNILNSNGFGWLKTIIEAFWWYIISVFIVKDISKKINKIKSGDFENIETNNIKEDML